MDPFTYLPNELLQEVFKHTRSLSQAFKLAAANQKFRENVLKVIQHPMPLTINFNRKTVMNYKIPVNEWPAAVEVLAKRVRFNGIWFEDQCPEGVVDTILNILKGTEHLHEVKTFDTVAGCNSAVLEEFLVKCEQLEALNLQFPLSRLPKPNVQQIDLGTVLNGKALSRLCLLLDEYPVGQLSAAFQSLAQNKLQKFLIQMCHPLDLVQLMREVPDGMWSALTALEVAFLTSNDAQLGLFEIVARMPLLLNCHILRFTMGGQLVPFDQFAHAVASLLNARLDRTNQLKIVYDDGCMERGSGCAVIHLFRQLQHNHPQLQFNIGLHLNTILGKLEFSLGNTSFAFGGHGLYCADVCAECCSFYPTVLISLLANGNLQGHQLDRCKVDRVVQDHNEALEFLPGVGGTALLATVNEAQDQATITFETAGHQQFNITVACGRCFNHSCVTCWQD